MTAAFLTWLLGLSFVSDYIKRHAEHYEPGEQMRVYRAWLRWGTLDEAWAQGPQAKCRWFIIVRVPGVYWEPDTRADFGRRVIPAGWRHKVLVWMEPVGFPFNDGWHERLVPIGAGAVPCG